MMAYSSRDGYIQIVSYRPTDLGKADKAPPRPTLPASLSKVHILKKLKIVKEIIHFFLCRPQVPPPFLLLQPPWGQRRSWAGEKVKGKVMRRKEEEQEQERNRRRRVGAAREATLSYQEIRRTLRAVKMLQLQACTAPIWENLLRTSVLWPDLRNRLLWSLLRRRGGEVRRRRKRHLTEVLVEFLEEVA